ncbi:MAG: hypothetical protein K1X91_14430, partial [Bacteriodetes bacterium]|nr:hypothetical protein [Bacteroidota bacterium]
MKTIILLLILSSSTIIYSQTIEPTPHSFNWGTYTAPFHDSTHTQQRMVMGWQWGGNDTSFDRFMGVNTVHDHNQLSDFWHAKYNDDTVKQIYELDAIKVVGITSRFDGEIVSNLSSVFQPNVFDSSGAVFGWGYRNNTIVSNDTATQAHPRGFAHLQSSTVGLALSGCQPKNLLSRIEVENTYSTRRRKMYLSVGIRRPDTTSTDTSQNTALTLKLKYWAHSTIRNWNNTADSLYLYQNGFYIKFDSIASNFAWTDRGYRNTKFSNVDTTLPDNFQQVFTIPRNLLPLDSTTIVREPTVTLSAVFLLDSIRNPLLRYEIEERNKDEKGFHIDSFDVEVYYQGFPVKLDYVSIRDSIDYELQQGNYDTLILNHIQNRITQYYNNRPNVKLWRISVSTEYRLKNAWSVRYIGKLLNGFVTSSYGFDFPKHSVHILQQKGYWSFGQISDVQSNMPAPWIASMKSDSIACWRGINNYVCGSVSAVMGYHHDRRSWGPFNSNFGDTLQSFWETNISVWNKYGTYPAFTGFAVRNQIQSFDTMQLEIFLDTLYDQRSTLASNEVKKWNYYSKYNDFSYLYSGKHWWAQKQLHTIYNPVHHFPDNIHYDPLGPQINIGYSRAKTGEEIGNMLFNDLILGCKGFMIDNGTYYPYGVVNYGLYLTLRKTGHITSPYNSDSPWDTDYWKRNDSTHIDQYIHPDRIIRLWGNEDTNKIYLGCRSARLTVRKIWKFMNDNSNELMRLQLVSWISKGFKTYYSGDTTNFSRAIFIQKDSVLVRPIGRVNWDNRPLYEPRDSTFYDITLLRDSSDSGVMLDSVFYIGVCNKRTDPLRYIHYPFNDTVSPKRLLFLSSAEFEDSCKVSIDSTQWRQLQYKQLGTREITIPFNYSHWDGKQHILRVQEIGGSLDTVISSHSKLPVILLPGEGKIFRVTIPSATASVALGDIQNSNQRKLVCYPKVEYDIGNNSFRELDTVYYHMCYHRVDTSDSRLKVYYRRSVPSIRGHVPVAGLQWQNEICLSQQPIIKLNYDTATMQAAYPSIVVRNDSVNRIPRVYVVFACEQNNS